MSDALPWEFVAVEDYLAAEERSEIKHEYREGVVYAMAGSRNDHSRVSSNGLASLGSQLRGKRCQAFNSDTKIRIRIPGDLRFYYPDMAVVCEQNPGDDHFQDTPAVILEVLSPSTRRTDLSEKKDAYLLIPTLEAYIVAEAQLPHVRVWRRLESGEIRQEVYEGLDAVIELPGIEAVLPLADLYDGVTFAES